jgi:hypothetical protein
MVEGIYDRHSYSPWQPSHGVLVAVELHGRTSGGPQRKPPYTRKPKKPAITTTTTTTPMM